MKKLLSVVVVEHDSNMSYFDGKQLHYIKLERYKQIKHYCYPTFWDWKYDIEKIWKISLEDLDEIVVDFSHKVYSDDKLPNNMKDVLSGKTNYTKTQYENIPVWYLSHHYSHAQSTWMLSDKTPDVHIVIDGLGDARTWSVFRNDQLVDCGTLEFGSIGFEMVNAGKYLGVHSSSEVDIAGKVMGLQSYGTIDYVYLNFLRQFNFKQVNQIFSKENWYQHKKDNLLARLTPLDWIRTVHYRMGEVLIDFFKTYAKPNELISYSGGVAQNVVWNTELKKHFSNLLIPPHSGDEGLSLGAIEWLRKKNNLPKFEFSKFPYAQSDVAPRLTATEETIKKTAKLLSEGKIVGWYQSNGEIGPRALGNRSILMDPRIENAKEKMNLIKRRENYRPFGASVLLEHANSCFELNQKDEYMLYTAKVLDKKLQSITHVDGTCRLQTVSNQNETFRKLLKEFYNLTECPVLMNTSLNIAGFPLASYPEIVIDIFKSTAIDCVVIGNEILEKEK
jgi:carbamoyltransferase